MTAPQAWIALVPELPADAAAASPAQALHGGAAGWLVRWLATPAANARAPRPPHPQARRVDARVLDQAGPPAFVSLVTCPHRQAPLFDDPAIPAALRRLLAGPAPDAFSTLVRDSVHFGGALTVVFDDPSRLDTDPFSTIGTKRLLSVPGGVFGSVPLPAGPATQRYAGAPWPAGAFGP